MKRHHVILAKGEVVELLNRFEQKRANWQEKEVNFVLQFEETEESNGGFIVADLKLVRIDQQHEIGTVRTFEQVYARET